MTKRQMLAECQRLAPTFRVAFHRAGDVDSLAVEWTDARGPVALAMTLGAEGRAAIESRLLGAALERLRREAKSRAA